MGKMKEIAIEREEAIFSKERTEKLARKFVTAMVVRGGAGINEMFTILESPIDIEEFIDAATEEFRYQTRMAFEYVEEHG